MTKGVRGVCALPDVARICVPPVAQRPLGDCRRFSGDCRKQTDRLAQDFRSPSRGGSGRIVELCARCRDAEGGRQDKPGGRFVDRNRLRPDCAGFSAAVARLPAGRANRRIVAGRNSWRDAAGGRQDKQAGMAIDRNRLVPSPARAWRGPCHSGIAHCRQAEPAGNTAASVLAARRNAAGMAGRLGALAHRRPGLLPHPLRSPVTLGRGPAMRHRVQPRPCGPLQGRQPSINHRACQSPWQPGPGCS